MKRLTLNLTRYVPYHLKTYMCEQYTIQESTQPIILKIDLLRKCDPPYEGNSDKELAEYFTENIQDDYYEWEERNRSVYGDEVDKLCLTEAEKEVYYDSRMKSGNLWLDVGETDEEYQRTGGFKIDYTTFDSEY